LRKIWFFVIFIILLGVVWAQIDTTDLKVIDLPQVPKKFVDIPIDTFLSVPELPSAPKEFFTVPIDSFLGIPDLPSAPKEFFTVPVDTFLSVPDLPSTPKDFFMVPMDSFLPTLNLPEVAPAFFELPKDTSLEIPHLPELPLRDFEAPQVAFLEIPDLLLPETQRFKIPEDIPLDSPDLPGTMWEDVLTVKDLRGGLDLVSAKTKIASNCASELENALWNPQGEMYMRPGYSEHSNPSFIPNFLYRFYRQKGSAFTMGGSDTALYFWHPDSSGDGWTYLIGTGGVSGRWDGTTYDRMFVATHKDITPVVWNGSTLVEIGTSIDSFEITGAASSCGPLPVCCPESVLIVFAGNYGWEDNKWRDYLLGFWADNDAPVKDECVQDTIYYKNMILASGSNWVKIRPSQFALASWPNPDVVLGSYARIYSWFGIDTVWRTGQLDSSVEICTLENPLYDYPLARLYDDDFVWDSLFNYEEWIFEVTAGKGIGQKTISIAPPNTRFTSPAFWGKAQNSSKTSMVVFGLDGQG